MWTATQVIGGPDGDNGLIYRSTAEKLMIARSENQVDDLSQSIVRDRRLCILYCSQYIQ